MTKKKKQVDSYEKDYLMKVIKHLEMCAEHNKGNDLEKYFKLKADQNKVKLKGLK